MKILKLSLALALGLIVSTACGAKETCEVDNSGNLKTEKAKVFFTKDISPEGLLKVYHALGVKPEGRVAVKISTGESMKSHQLSPELIAPLVKEVNGTLVECNTAYPGTRNTTEKHLQTVKEHGYDKIAKVDIMDSEGSMKIPVQDTTWMKYDLVGKHLANYDFMINLAHFKGHAMGGFGGVLKNQSIGVASSDGKAYIHTAGAHDSAAGGNAFKNPHGQDAFIESMAAAAQGVHNYFKGKVLYIDVMNNLSVDCDCDGNAHEPLMKDIGILASLDPVALDKACVDIVFNHKSSEDDDSAPLIERIETRHGTHILPYAEKIGLGTQSYEIVNLDK